MSRAFRSILWVLLPLIALLGGWNLWRLAAAPGPPRAAASTGAESERAESERAEAERQMEEARREERERRERTAAWLRSRLPHVRPVTGPESFEVPEAVEAARPQFQAAGLQDRDVRAAVRHAAELLDTLLVQSDPEALTRWRLDYGYRFYPIERLRTSSFARRWIERTAGRKLAPDETDSLPIWRDLCRQMFDQIPPIRGVDAGPDGAIVVVTRSEEGLAVRVPEVAPYRKPTPNRISQSRMDPSAPDLWRLWSGGGSGVIWPMWFPPDDVDRRLQAPGTAFVEVAYVLQLQDRSLLPLSLVMGMDPVTRRWWLMQYYVYRSSGDAPTAGLLRAGGL
jgi:hypothetical protein